MRLRSWVTALLMASLVISGLPVAASARTIPDAAPSLAALPAAATGGPALAVPAGGAAPQAAAEPGPRIFDARVSVSGGDASRSDVGDEIALTFDKAIDANLVDNVIRVTDGDGGVYDIACNGVLTTGNGLVDATCTWDSAQLVLRIRMLGDSALESAAAHGTGPAGLQWPGTIVGTTGITDLAGAAVDLTGSADLVIELGSPPIVVNAADDVVDGSGCNATHCSLREAIVAANASPGPDRIHFAIPGIGPHTITVTGSPLPAIAQPVSLDGLTQPGSTVGAPQIVLSGSGLGAGVGIAVTGGGSVIRGLAITRFPHAGVHLLTNGGNRVVGNMIGGVAAGNLEGVVIESPNNVIGGATASGRNVISGNSGRGVLVLSGAGNVISGNYIGTNAAGVLPGPNGGSGVHVDGASGVRIGGPLVGERNVISGNGMNGVKITGAGATGNTIQGNYIGIGADGASDVANQVGGLDIQTANNMLRGNVISANNVVGPASHGVVLETAQATGNVIAGNLIGPRANGTGGAPNVGSGVLIRGGASNNTIGGPEAADRNVISNNASHGVHIASRLSTGNVIAGNYIGLAPDGMTPLPNGRTGTSPPTAGVFLSEPLASTMGPTTIRNNVISANVSYGISIDRAAGAHSISGNIIGLAADGLTARPNTSVGLNVYLGESPQSAAITFESNTISGNAVHGLYLYGLGGATLRGNRIGLASTGQTLVGNGSSGIVMLAGANNIVHGNEIAGNGDGIRLGQSGGGSGSTGNTLSQNVIRANGSAGIVMNGATSSANRITEGSISGHSGKGISLLAGANAGIVAPAVTSVSSGDGLRIAGTGVAGNTVAIYADPGDEGLEFLGTVVVAAGGTWQKSSGWVNPDTSAIEAALRARTRVITATQTDANGNTSEFSSGLGVPALARGTAQHRETPNGTTIITVTLGGAVVTLIPPTGLKRRTTADLNGNFSFGTLLPNTAYVVGYDGTVAGRHYISGVRFTTDAFGDATIPAPQAVYNRKNHTWVRPFTLTDNVPVADQVWRRGQATWYRFAIAPQTSVTIELTGCAFNCDLVVYKDLEQVRKKLEADAQTQAGHRLSMQGDIFADDLDADDLDADDLDADDLDADDLDADDLDADDLDADDLDADDLDADDLDADDLDADDLDANADDTDGDGLTGYGTTYVAVQRKGLRAASLTPGLAPETVVFNTRDLTGYLYVRVAGGSSLSGVFSVKARRTADVSCATAPLVATGTRIPSTIFGTGGAAVAGKRSLILTDTKAYGLTLDADKTVFLGKLTAFADHPTVQGHVVDLADDTGIQQLRADWAAAPRCIAQTNLVTDGIREVVQRFRAASGSFEYLINVGGDAVVPMRRVADWAEISRESRYSPPLDPLSPSEASLVNNTFLSDDFYVGAAIEGSNRTLYLPDVAVGRLVESVADVTAYIDMYLAAGGTAAPTRALSSGYDFNLDLAAYVTAGLSARGLDVDSSLVSNTWSSAAWRDAVLNGPAASAFGILSLQGHFSASRLVPADNGQRVLSTEIAAVTDGRFMRALVYSLGCHSGYSVVNADASIFTQPLAFPEAFVSKGATLVGGTGYQYGETVLLKNTEALMARLTDELGYNAPPSGAAYVNGVPIGKALMYAKRAYMAQTATPRGIDLKVVNVSTVYGSPTMRFELPKTHSRPASVTVSPTALGGGLSALSLTPSYTLTQTTTNGTSYYSAGGATTTAPYRPIAPLVTVPATAAGSVLTGAVFLGGPYTEALFTPKLSIPATELTGDAPRYANDVFMPVLPVKTNLFDSDTVQIVPFQYRSNALGTSGTARVFSNVSLRGYWSSRTGTTTAAEAPVIRDVSVKVEGGQLVVFATVRGLIDPGIAEVYVTYTDTSAASRSFESLLMTAVPLTTVSDGVGLPGFTRLYRAALTGTPSALRFLVQAVSGNGRVAAATSNGQLYGMPAADPPAIDTRPASAIVLSAPATATYKSRITVSATLTAPGLSLQNKMVRFELGGSSAIGITNASGYASAALEVNVTPRDIPYALTASFAGDATATGSGASREVTVGRAVTVLQPIQASTQYSDSASVARLISGNLTLNEQPVLITRGGVTVATATDFAGEVRFDTMDFGAGVSASELTITYPGNTRYAPTSVTVTPSVVAESATLILAQDPQPTGLLTISATVLQQADGSLGDLTLANVAFTVTTESGTLLTSETVPVSAAGVASFTRSLPVGLYRVAAALLSSHFVADPVAVTLPIYDPAIFVSGGGWVLTGSTPTGVPANARGHVAFIAKYLSDNITPSINLNVHVKSATGKDNDTDAQAQANGSLKFKAAASDWLLIAGNGAAFSGTGTVNGAAGYRYRADVVDGTPDVFVIHIWDPALGTAAGGSYESPKHVVRGNLAGGSIRIHR